MSKKPTKKEQEALDRLDREFDHYNVVVTLEQQEQGRAEYLQQRKVLESPPGFREHEDGDRPAVLYKGKMQLGGLSDGEERKLKDKVRKDMKELGFTEEFRTVKAEAGRKGGKKSKGGGRKKGTRFDARLGRFVSAKEREKEKQ